LNQAGESSSANAEQQLWPTLDASKDEEQQQEQQQEQQPLLEEVKAAEVHIPVENEDVQA